MNSDEFLANPRNENERLIADLWVKITVKSYTVRRICHFKNIFTNIPYHNSPVELAYNVLQWIIREEGCEIDDCRVIDNPALTFNSLFSWILKEKVALALNQVYLLLVYFFSNYHDSLIPNAEQSISAKRAFKLNRPDLNINFTPSDSNITVAPSVLPTQVISKSVFPSVAIPPLQNEAVVLPPALDLDNEWDDFSFYEFGSRSQEELGEQLMTKFVPENQLGANYDFNSARVPTQESSLDVIRKRKGDFIATDTARQISRIGPYSSGNIPRSKFH